MNKTEAAQKLHRNELGLFDSIEYVFDDFGFINWRATLPKQYLCPNRFHFEAQGKEVPTSIEGLEDNQLFISLGGIKWLARARGYTSVDFSTFNKDGGAVASCFIKWIPNYENPAGASYSEVASCTENNSAKEHFRYAESIAANRAFVRCVRNFLNINIVGEDEVSTSSGTLDSAAEPTSSSIRPIDILMKNARAKNMALPDLKALCLKEGFLTPEGAEKITSEVSFGKILPASSLKKLIKILKNPAS
jgi:hypothetical protein